MATWRETARRIRTGEGRWSINSQAKLTVTIKVNVACCLIRLGHHWRSAGGPTRARAAASPAFVRSRIRERSNSASPEKIWKTSLPPGVVVSIGWVMHRSSTGPAHRKIALDIVRFMF
jgi:hypothetical protein